MLECTGEWKVVEESKMSQIKSLGSLFNLTTLPFLACCEKLSVVTRGRTHARKLCVWCVKTCFSQEASFLHVLNNVLL